jgi:hypothetical protein
MINFPLYAMRDYVAKTVEGDYIIIQGRSRKYVLDYIPEVRMFDTYSDRRLELLRDTSKPYELYPINIIVESIAQIHKCGYKMFLDKYGKQVQWKPQGFVKVKTCLIRTTWQDQCGIYHVVASGCHTVFKLREYNGERYIRVANFNGVEVVHDLTMERQKDTRIKL